MEIPQLYWATSVHPFAALIVKGCVNWNFPSGSVCLPSVVFSLCTLVLFYLKPPFKYWKTEIRFPTSLASQISQTLLPQLLLLRHVLQFPHHLSDPPLASLQVADLSPLWRAKKLNALTLSLLWKWGDQSSGGPSLLLSPHIIGCAWVNGLEWFPYLSEYKSKCENPYMPKSLTVEIQFFKNYLDTQVTSYLLKKITLALFALNLSV